ncbi:ATP synthase F1 subunit epsilon [Candidatus Sumerlaeota bacterium]|nr:ATP synthase F1 subunit epsilon [Candidatus Sumerlaeota bacterium]
MSEFKLQVVTPEHVVLDENVTSIVAPGAAGYLGVLAHHASLLTTLAEGPLTIKRDESVRAYRISGGFLEVHNNVATILCDSIH